MAKPQLVLAAFLLLAGMAACSELKASQGMSRVSESVGSGLHAPVQARAVPAAPPALP